MSKNSKISKIPPKNSKNAKFSKNSKIKNLSCKNYQYGIGIASIKAYVLLLAIVVKTMIVNLRIMTES